MDPVLMEALVSFLCATRDVAKEYASQSVLHGRDEYDTEWLETIYYRQDLVNVFLQGLSIAQTLDATARDQLLRASVTGLECLATFLGYLSTVPKLEAHDLVSRLMAMILDNIHDGVDWKPAMLAVTNICEAEETFVTLGRSDVIKETVVPMLLQLMNSSAKNVELKVLAVATVANSARSVRDLLLDGIFQDFSISAETDEGYLRCLSSLVNLYKDEDGSKRPMLVAMEIFSSVEALPDEMSSSQQILQVLKPLMEIVGASVSKCDITYQDAILQRAIDVYSHLPGVTWPGALLSSVASSSRPSILLQNLEAVDLLYDLAVRWEKNEVIAEGLASVLNKWSITQPSLDAVIDHLLGKPEMMALANESTQLVQAAHILVWMAKALAMRGHSKVSDIAGILLRLLMANLEADVSRVAAKGFGIIMEEARGLNKDNHAMERPLYKQKFFVSLLKPMLQALKTEENAASRPWLIRGFSYLAVSTPLAALFSEAGTVFPLMLSMLSTLASDPRDKEVLQAMLLVVSSFLLKENQRELVGQHVSTLLNQLTELTLYPHSWVVRQTSIQCLCAAVNLPYASIYPFKQQIKKALRQALDDKRRVVRQEAARCYQTWLST